MFENIYFSIFTVESFIPFIYLFLAALFLMNIPQKTRATFHIAMSLFIFSTLPLCYLFASSIYHPAIAYNRWIAAYASIPSALHVILVFFHFPNTVKPKLAKTILIGGWILTVIGWVAFIISTLDANTKYLFSGHNYDIDAVRQQKIVASAILFMVGAFTITGIWRAIRERKKNGWLVLSILFSYLVVTVIPGATNLLSRQGIISRGAHYFLFDLLTVLGIFFLIIIYINNVQERTSFMIKIIGISLIVILLALQFGSDFLMNEKESDFDHQKYLTAKVITLNNTYPDDLKYIVEYEILNSQQKNIHIIDESGININFNKFIGQFTNAFFMDSVSQCKNIICVKNEIYSKLYSNKYYFQGYQKTYLHILNNLKEKEKNEMSNVDEFIQKILDFQTDLRKYRILTENISEKNFKKEFKKKFLNKNIKKIIHFQKAIRNYVNNHPRNFDKKHIIPFFSILQKPEIRYYREDPLTGKHYISYLIPDKNSKKITEIGFDYLSYRKFLHAPAQMILIMLSIVLLFLLIGFQVFFLGALIKPLNNLLNGLKDVQKGDLNVTLKVKVEDEIGFITRSFNSMVRSIKLGELRLQRYAKGLESKVKERTAELSESLEAVQKLKTQQDGDYFLTSLILKPLGPNRAKSENVFTDFIVEQKKKFKFNKWESDIGGDICITDNIVLNNRNYVVFVNGDAMGKSLQGAGGALILGAAFQSVLERSRLSKDVKRQSPERWLKNTFTEMHTIFESFDGSMLMSAVIGLVDEASGFMYFINAEHPWVVLYRDGRAEFIEKDYLFRKLGSAITAGRIFVQTFQLTHGDIIISGSDGRDDIKIGESEDGERIINEDEKLFLRAIEKGEGELTQVVEEIKKSGELADDLSLLRIEYNHPNRIKEPDDLLNDYLTRAKVAKKNKNFNEATHILEKAKKGIKHHPKLFKELFKSYLIIKDYTNAVLVGTEYCNEVPSDTQSLFALSYALKIRREYQKAIDTAERVRLREPKMVNNLVNLSECYFKIREYERSQKIAKEIISIDINNKHARTILNMIKAKEE